MAGRKTVGAQGYFDLQVTCEGPFHKPPKSCFLDGMQEFVRGNESKARQFLAKAGDLADAAFMAGILALKAEDFGQAERHLKVAKQKHGRLGHYFSNYGIETSVGLPITKEVFVILQPDLRGVLLALTETHQHQDRCKEAAKVLKALRRQDPDDVVV